MIDKNIPEIIYTGNIIRSEERDHPQRPPAFGHVHSSHHVTRNFWKHLP